MCRKLPELSDVRTLTLVLLQLLCTTKCGESDVEEYDNLPVSLFLCHLYQGRIPNIIDRVVGSADT